jgi:hypothetical protein
MPHGNYPPFYVDIEYVTYDDDGQNYVTFVGNIKC